jgi:hypothetical protein
MTSYASSSYAMWLWGFQDRGNKPELSHTYALFAKINGDSIEEFYPISWVPRDGSVGLVTGDERGINLSIKQTFNLIKKILGNLISTDQFLIDFIRRFISFPTAILF